MAKTDKLIAESLEKIRQTTFPPQTEFSHLYQLNINDLKDLEFTEILSKDVGLGNIKDDNLMALHQQYIEILSLWAAMAKEEPLLAPFYKTIAMAWIAELRATKAKGGMGYSGQLAPFGWSGSFGTYGIGRAMEEEGEKKGMFDFLKGKKIFRGKPPEMGAIGKVGNERW